MLYVVITGLSVVMVITISARFINNFNCPDGNGYSDGRFESKKCVIMIKKTKAELISAGEIVQKYGVTYQAVNHYTNLGLLQVVTRNGNARLYAKAKVKNRLTKIAELVSEGYSLRLIRKKLIGV